MNIYRVEVVELDEAGEMVAAVVASLTAERDTLAKFAPGVVAQVLGASAASVTVEATYAADEPTTADAEPTEADKPKRTRRTKAQMEADRLAELGVANAAEANAVANGVMPTELAPEPAYNPFA